MNTTELIKELIFKAVRSSGPGGQNVNKVASKVVLYFNINHSEMLTDDEKNLLFLNLKNRISNEGILQLHSDSDRSQLKNKQIVTKRFFELLANALQIPEMRKATKIPKSVIKKRIKDKKNQSEIKRNRQKPEL